MRKLAEVQKAKNLMHEAMEWSAFKWSFKTATVRETADQAKAALDRLERAVKARWTDEAKAAYKSLTAKAGKAAQERQKDRQQPSHRQQTPRSWFSWRRSRTRIAQRRAPEWTRQTPSMKQNENGLSVWREKDATRPFMHGLCARKRSAGRKAWQTGCVRKARLHHVFPTNSNSSPEGARSATQTAAIKKARCHCTGPVSYRALSCRSSLVRSSLIKSCCSPCGKQSARQLPYATLKGRFQ